MLTLGDILLDLAAAFPRNKLEARTVEVYARDLADVPLSLLDEAAGVLRRTSEFFPTIRALREQAAELVLALPNENEALSQVEMLMVWRRRDDDARGDLPPIHPDVKSVLDAVGGIFAFRTADEPAVVRGQFLRLYREQRAERIRAQQVGAPAPRQEALPARDNRLLVG